MTSKLTQLFDIRNVIGALLGIYGVVLTIAGFAPALLRERDKGAQNNPVDLYFGTEANWWVGLALIVVSAVFITWALLRPVKVEEPLPSESGPESAPQ
jgi:heme/copper-type cytochrome/quinol oxidase subunit 2